MKMVKKTALIFVAVLMLAMCFAFAASAEGELTEGAFTYTVANDKATIVKVDALAEDGLFVPTELGGYPVEAIDMNAFEGCENLATVHFCGTQQDWDILTGGAFTMILHLAEIVAETPATCENTGLTAGVRCAACDKWFTEQTEIPALGHSFTDYQSDNNATIFADGTKTAYCDNNCGEWDTLTDEGSKIVFGKPESVTSVTTTSSITLNWTPVEGATGYRVFYLTASGWKKCTTLTATTHSFYKLKPAAKYTFAVRAYNLTDGVVTWAPTYSTYETSTQAVAPAKITVAQNTSAIKLSWTACSGATGYRIYYKLPTETVWKVSVSTTSNTTHTYTKLKPGSKYDFAIRPYIKTANAVIWSAYTTYTAATMPATPDVFVLSRYPGEISITWYNVNGADGYQLYYKLNNGSYKLYKTYTRAQMNLMFSNLNSADKYTFAIRAGIRTSGGVVWSDYTPKTVSVMTRSEDFFRAIKNKEIVISYSIEQVPILLATKGSKRLCIMGYDSEGYIFRMVYNKDGGYWYYIYDDIGAYTIIYDDDLSESAEDMLDIAPSGSSNVNIKGSKTKINGKTYFVETFKADGETTKLYYDTEDNLVRIDSTDAYGETVVITVYEFSDSVSNSYFTIPSNYTYVEAE